MRLLALPLILLLSLPAFAASPRDREGKVRDPRADPDRRAKVMEKIDTIRIAKLTDALDLDAGTAEKLFPVLRPFQERRREAHVARFEAMRRIRDLLDGDVADGAALEEALDALSEADRALARVEGEEFEALKKVLDPVRRAKYYRFQLEFERRVGEIIREVRGGGAGDGPGGSGGGFRDRERRRDLY